MPFETIVIEKVKVPDELLEFCKEPSLDPLETTGDLERIAGEAVANLAACNVDKARIKAWQGSE
ncbi:MAG: hypothetical protein E4H01_10685 [Lysobacterales bacterium]|nr:MAG: hypothetical protein E4H01_10685 [Xanthomonadales bacterium]